MKIDARLIKRVQIMKSLVFKDMIFIFTMKSMKIDNYLKDRKERIEFNFFRILA